MKNTLHKNLMLILIILFTSVSIAQDLPNHRYIVFDITGSMVGRGVSNENIWNKAINLLEKQLNSFANEEKISLILFGSQVYDKGTFTIDKNENTVDEIMNIVRNVEIKERFETCTCSYFALNFVFDKFDKQKSINTAYLFTDGNQTRDCHDNCNRITAIEAISKFDSKTKDSDYLYIYKLKPKISIPTEIIDNENVIVINNPFSELIVTATPFNSKIMYSKKTLSSNQKFNLTGTGVNEFLESNGVNINISSFKLINNNSPNQPAELNPDSLLLNEDIQELDLVTMNSVEVFNNEIYNGSVDYIFDNGTNNRLIRINDTIRINIKILPNKSKVVFDNSRPTVNIKYID